MARRWRLAFSALITVAVLAQGGGHAIPSITASEAVVPAPKGATPVSTTTVSGPVAASYHYHYIDTPGNRGFATAVSDNRIVVGYYITQVALPFVHVYTPNFSAITTTLPIESGFTMGAALTISPDGLTIAGFESAPGSPAPCYAVRWQKQSNGNYAITRLAPGSNVFTGSTVQTDCSVKGYSALDSGAVYVLTPDPSVVLLWNAGSVTTLTDPTGGVPGHTRTSNRFRIEDRGSKAFAKAPNQPEYELQPLSQTVSIPTAFASSVSDHREVVGVSRVVFTASDGTSIEVNHAVRWYDDGSPVDLNTITAYGSDAPSAGGGFDNPEHVALTFAIGLNKDGDIAGAAVNGLRSPGVTSPMLLLALPPIVFVPGVSGSHLVDSTGATSWLNLAGSHYDLGLTSSQLASAQPGGIFADRILEHECGISPCPDALEIYGPFLDTLKASGFLKYDDGASPFNRSGTGRTTSGCDLAQRPNNPNLFLFPYDWRLPNSRTARALADFMGCVRQFYPGPVILAAHSMGGLVSRRYLLDQVPTSSDDQADSNVRDLVTIGTPWLGAAKFANVIETGDFLPFILNATIRTIIPTMYGPRELMPSAAYYSVSNTVAFRENGWDINRNGTDVETYTYDELNRLLNAQHPQNVDVTDDAVAFHGNAGQDDWRLDAVGVRSTVLYAVQHVDATIGQVTATNMASCVLDPDFESYTCSTSKVFVTSVTSGDGTVPATSASRQGDHGISNDIDLNDPSRERLIKLTSGPDSLLEHVALPGNPEVERQLLFIAGRCPTVSLCAPQALGTSATVSLASVTSTPAAPVSAAAASPSEGWYVQLAGFTGTTAVTGPGGISDAVDPATPGYRPVLTGVTHIAEGEASELTVLPSTGADVYSEAFTAGPVPLSIEVRRGTQSAPTTRATWLDLHLPAGATGTITLATDGTPSLTYVSAGQATPVTVPPTALVTGDLARNGLVAPTVSATSIVIGGTRQYVLSADNGGIAPITRILWSADGTTFHRYNGPIALDPATTGLRAFADDGLGNRSPLREIDLATATPAPFTTATTYAALPANGWSPGPVNVLLRSHGSDNTTTSLHYTVIPPTGRPTVTVTQATSATIDVTADGQTTIRYYTTDNSGAREGERTIRVGVDSTTPTAAITTPADGSTSSTFPSLAGTALDTVSGVSSVSITVQRNIDAKYWNGTTWQTGAASLPALGSASWSYRGALPVGSDANEGAYTVTVKATAVVGAAGTARNGFSIGTAASIHDLALPAGSSGTQSEGNAVNTSGQAAGRIGQGLYLGYWAATTWDPNGVPRVLHEDYGGQVPTEANGLNDAGQAVGHAAQGAVRWDADGTQRTLPACTDVFAVAYAINATGKVAGQCNGVWGTWAGLGSFVPLPVPSGYTSSAFTLLDIYALTGKMAINGAGTVVGTRLVTVPGLPNHFVATMASSTSASFLFSPDTGLESHAFGIDNAGNVVGGLAQIPGRFSDTPYTPFLRAPDGAVTMLDITGAGFTAGEARGINQLGVIVGFGTKGDGSTHAWVRSGGVAKDLNDLLPAGSGWVLVSANGINDAGQIVGDGLRNGIKRGFVFSLGGGQSVVPAPVALDQTVSGAEGTPVDVALHVQNPPSGTLAWSVVGAPAHGTAQVTASTATYAPDAGFTGTDSFLVRAVAGPSVSNTATITVVVRPLTAPSHPPVAIILAPSAVGQGTSFAVDGADSFDPDTFGAITYAWDFGGGSGFADASTAQAILSLPDPGPHVIRLKVTSGGGSAIAETTVDVVPTSPGTPPPDGGSLVLTTTLTGSGASGYPGAFGIVYDCSDGTAHDGTAWLTPGARSAIGGIPSGTTCTVNEPALPSIAGYSFGTPVLDPVSGTVTIPEARGASRTVTVANSLTRDVGALHITKTVTGTPGGFTGSFVVDISCTRDGGTYGARTISYPTTGDLTIANVPSGSSCTVTEQAPTGAPTGHAWGAVVITGSPATIAKGATSEVTIDNVVDGTTRVIKTMGRAALSGTQAFTFELRNDAAAPDVGGGLLDTKVANAANGGTVTFAAGLVPGRHYQVCEIVDVAWQTTLGPNPFPLTLSLVNDRICADLTAAAGVTTTFNVDNTPPPGGGARSIGYWKNHSSCKTSAGSQTPILDQTLARFPIARQEKTHGFYVGNLYVDTCVEAFALLNKTTLDGTKAASNPAWKFASQYAAYLVNVMAGAAPNATAAAAGADGQAVLVAIGFKGTLPLTISSARATSLTYDAGILDRYNNNRLP